MTVESGDAPKAEFWSFDNHVFLCRLRSDPIGKPSNPAECWLRGNDGFSTGIIVPKASSTLRLEDLIVLPHIGRYEVTMNSVSQVVYIADQWSSARLSGDLLSVIRKGMYCVPCSTSVSINCGDRWTQVENQIVAIGTSASLASASVAVSQAREEIGLGPNVLLTADHFVNSSSRELVSRLADLITEHRLLQSAQVQGRGLAEALNTQQTLDADNPLWLSGFR